jgi:hypothetical protein
MRLSCAILKTPPKSSVPPRLPFYKSRTLRTPSESTLPQLFIPPGFNSRISNTYKKPGEGGPPFSPKVLQLVTPLYPKRIGRGATLFARLRINIIPWDLPFLCFRTLRHSFALCNPPTLLPSTVSALFHQNTRGDTPPPKFRFSIFVFRVRRSQDSLLLQPHCGLSAGRCWRSAAAYFPRNFSMVESSASAMSRYFLAALVSCFCMADCALEMSVFMRCWAETMSPRRP